MSLRTEFCCAYLRWLMCTDQSRLFSVIMSQKWYLDMHLEWAAAVGVDHSDVLEVGCGPGLLAGRLKSPSNTVRALDRSVSMIRRARQAALTNKWDVEFIEADVSDAARSLGPIFDRVIGSSVINVTKDRRSFAGSLAALLKPGGIVSILAPTPALTEPRAKALSRQAGHGPLESAVLLTWSRAARKLTVDEMMLSFQSDDFCDYSSALYLDGMVGSVTARRTERIAH